MHKYFLVLSSLLVLSSCDKKLDERIVRGTDIEISWYRISTITTIRQYVDVTRDSDTEQLIKADDGSIEFIYIQNDTIFIREKMFPSFYKSKDSIFNYKVVYIHK